LGRGTYFATKVVLFGKIRLKMRYIKTLLTLLYPPLWKYLFFTEKNRKKAGNRLLFLEKTNEKDDKKN
jgi:hypothetical protein